MKKAKQVQQEGSRRRQQIVTSIMGGKCALCGYDKSSSALDCHHIDPDKKEFCISSKWKTSLSKMDNELRKCVLLCRNCHSEFHYGLHDDIHFLTSFDAKVFDYYLENMKCAIRGCSNYISPFSAGNTCSRECRGKLAASNSQKRAKALKKERLASGNMHHQTKIDWFVVDVLQVVERNGYNMLASGRELGISDVAVRKRYKKVMKELEWLL